MNRTFRDVGAISAGDSIGTPEGVSVLIDRLRCAQTTLRKNHSVDSILERLGAAVDNWLRPDSMWRLQAEEHLPRATGFSAEMIRFGLPWVLEPLRAPALATLLDAELGDRRVLDGGASGRLAVGPDVVLHILSGNLPALAAIPIALSLAIKSGTLIKAAGDDRVFPGLFADSIAEVDPELGECVAACYWPGGDRAWEKRAFTGAGLVVASGDDATIAELRSRCPARFIGHGHKISFAVVTTDDLRHAADAKAAAAGLAVDISIWDQRGCLSPQVCFVEGDFDDACAFARLLAPELAGLARRLPPAVRTVAENVGVRNFRDEAEWQRVGGRARMLLSAEGGFDWTVIVEDQPAFRPTPLCRSLRMLPIRDTSDLAALLSPVRSMLEGAGRVPESARRAEVDDVLARAGVHWIAPLGSMQRPPLSWPQGGRPRVADWVTWSQA